MAARRENHLPELGQATLLLLGLLAALLAGTLILFGFGQAAVFENGLPNPRHLSNDEYLAMARRAALRNGVAPGRVSVSSCRRGSRPRA